MSSDMDLEDFSGSDLEDFSGSDLDELSALDLRSKTSSCNESIQNETTDTDGASLSGTETSYWSDADTRTAGPEAPVSDATLSPEEKVLQHLVPQTGTTNWRNIVRRMKEAQCFDLIDYTWVVAASIRARGIAVCDDLLVTRQAVIEQCEQDDNMFAHDSVLLQQFLDRHRRMKEGVEAKRRAVANLL
jgi:hypothetical protein